MLTALEKTTLRPVLAAAVAEEFHLPVVLIVRTICENKKKDCTKKIEKGKKDQITNKQKKNIKTKRRICENKKEKIVQKKIKKKHQQKNIPK